VKQPTGSRQELLDTDAALVPDGLAGELASFAERHPEVRAAYLCLTERTVAGEQPIEELRLSFEFVDPPTEAGDPRARELATAFIRECEEWARLYGAVTLGAAGIRAWQKHAQLVYARPI
jgi:hypothetical protein